MVTYGVKGNTGGVTVCCAVLEDIPDWLELVSGVSEDFPGLDMEEYAKTLAENIDRRTALCAKADGETAGVLLFSPEERMLSFLAVKPGFRRRGAASALIGEMLRLMPEGDISVTTYREDDPKGYAPRALYRKLGFEPEELLTEFDYPVQRFVLYRN